MRGVLKFLRIFLATLFYAAPIPLAVLEWTTDWDVPWWAYFASAYTAEAVLMVVGGLVVLGLSLRGIKATKLIESRAENRDLILTWKYPWAYLWGNEDEGINPLEPPTNPSGQRWWDKTRNWPWWLQAWWWSSIRNPVSNLRWTWWAAHYDPNHFEMFGNDSYPGAHVGDDTNWLWGRQGWKPGLWAVKGDHTLARLGWGIGGPPPRPIDGHHAMKFQVYRER